MGNASSTPPNTKMSGGARILHRIAEQVAQEERLQAREANLPHHRFPLARAEGALALLSARDVEAHKIVLHPQDDAGP